MNGPRERSIPFTLEDVDKCLLCGHRGKEVLYEGLGDHLLGVPGSWTYERCLRCTLVFLDPRPTEEDIGKAYASYPTHSPASLPPTLLRRLRSYAKRGYLANRFGYLEGVGGLQTLLGWLFYLHPGQREYANGSIMYLPVRRRGRVLDVGAGAGEVLSELRSLGWEVEGVDPDAEAAQSALRNHGLKLRTGTLEAQGYPADHFDAVVTSHVIEHVHDPVGLLRECRRVLRPGGMLVLATPNAESLGHEVFRAHWRVLEPPRHLTIFSRQTLSRLATEAGFSGARIRTTVRGADGIYMESSKLRAAGASTVEESSIFSKEKMLGQVFLYGEWAVTKLRPWAGEELLMVAAK